MSTQISGKLIFPWTFTKLTTYEACPFKARLKFIDKVRVPEKSVFVRGNAVHEIMELYLTNQLVRKDMYAALAEHNIVLSKNIYKMLHTLKRQYVEDSDRVLCEKAVGLDRNWQELPDWFHPDTWARIKMDVIHHNKRATLEIIDFKTGKMYPEHEDQAIIYGVAGWRMYQEIPYRTVRIKHVYLDHGHIEATNFRIIDLEYIEGKILKRIEKMEKEKNFDATPSKSKCQWCEFSTKRGGCCSEFE